MNDGFDRLERAHKSATRSFLRAFFITLGGSAFAVTLLFSMGALSNLALVFVAAMTALLVESAGVTLLLLVEQYRDWNSDRQKFADTGE
jgi:hypothetical protein